MFSNAKNSSYTDAQTDKWSYLVQAHSEKTMSHYEDEIIKYITATPAQEFSKKENQRKAPNPNVSEKSFRKMMLFPSKDKSS